MLFKSNFIRDSLNRLPEDFYENYDDWVKVGMALHDEFNDSDHEQDAISLYDEFSQKSAKYQRGAALRKWKSFQPGGGISLGTIFFNAPKPARLSVIKEEDRISEFQAYLDAV